MVDGNGDQYDFLTNIENLAGFRTYRINETAPAGLMLTGMFYPVSEVGQLLMFGRMFSDGSPISETPPSAAPEPSSLMLLGSGLIGLAGAARRKFRRA